MLYIFNDVNDGCIEWTTDETLEPLLRKIVDCGSGDMLYRIQDNKLESYVDNRWDIADRINPERINEIIKDISSDPDTSSD